MGEIAKEITYYTKTLKKTHHDTLKRKIRYENGIHTTKPLQTKQKRRARDKESPFLQISGMGAFDWFVAFLGYILNIQMKDKRFETLYEKYSLPKKVKKKFKRVECTNCYGGQALQTYPASTCSKCNGVGYVEEEEKDAI